MINGINTPEQHGQWARAPFSHFEVSIFSSSGTFSSSFTSIKEKLIYSSNNNTASDLKCE